MSVSLINNVLYSLLLLCPLVVIFYSAVIEIRPRWDNQD